MTHVDVRYDAPWCGVFDACWRALCEWAFRLIIPFPDKICWVFGRLRDLMANICCMKRDIDNRSRALGRTKSLLHCPKMSWTLVHKWLKTGPEFVTHCFVPSQSIAHPLSGINVARYADSKWNDIGFFCSSDSKPKNVLSWKCYRVGRP